MKTRIVKNKKTVTPKFRESKPHTKQKEASKKQQDQEKTKTWNPAALYF